MSNIITPQEPTIQEKVYNLTVELQQAEREAKALSKAARENVKRIKDELKELLDNEETELATAQREVIDRE